MEETVEQKIIRNIQGNFAVFKTTEVVGAKSLVPNLEWEDSEDIDKFFMFAKNLGAKVIYVSEGEEETEDGQIKNVILQVGFLHDGIMHHINFVEDDEEDDDEEGEEFEDSEDEEDEGEELPEHHPEPAPHLRPEHNPESHHPNGPIHHPPTPEHSPQNTEHRPPHTPSTEHRTQPTDPGTQNTEYGPQNNSNNQFIGGGF